MSVVSLIAVIALAASPQGAQKSIYEQVISQPDPYNGYEDYVRAADIVNDPMIGVYLSWTPKQYEQELETKAGTIGTGKGGDGPREEWTPEREQQLQLAKHLHDLDYLGVQRELIGRYGRALDQVRVGNQKKVWQPRKEMRLSTTFRELAQFKTLAKLLAAEAYVKAAAGDSKGLTSAILDGITLGRSISGSTLINYLVGSAIQAILLASAEEHLSRLSDADTQRIVQYVDQFLKAPDPLVDVVKAEQDFVIGSLDEIFSNPDAFTGGDSDSEAMKSFGTFAAKMTPTERQAAKDKMIGRLRGFYSKEVLRLKGEESTWFVKDPEVQVPNTVNSIDDFIDVLVDIVTPVFSGAYSNALMRRAQVRLLGLHARIIDYRWRNHRLPRELKEAVPAALLSDPMGKSEFVYELNGESYKLYSRGLDSTGPVELRYRRPPNLGQDQGPIPPLAKF